MIVCQISFYLFFYLFFILGSFLFNTYFLFVDYCHCLLPCGCSLVVCLFFRCLPMSLAHLCITCSLLAHLCIACSSHARLHVAYSPTCCLLRYPPNLFFLLACCLLPWLSPTYMWYYLFPRTYLCRCWREEQGGQLPLR